MNPTNENAGEKMREKLFRDQPLRAEVIDGRIVISIGCETLKYCHNRLEHEFEPRKGYGSEFLITDAEGFANDIVDRLEHERDQLKAELTKAQEENKRLHRIIVNDEDNQRGVVKSDFFCDMANLQSDLTRANDEVKRLREECAGYERQIHEWHFKGTQIARERDQLKAEMDKWKDKARCISTPQGILRDENIALRAELAKAREEINLQYIKHGDLRETIEHYKDKNDSLTSNLTRANDEVNQLKADLEITKAEYAMLSTAYKKEQAVMERLEKADKIIAWFKEWYSIQPTLVQESEHVSQLNKEIKTWPWS